MIFLFAFNNLFRHRHRRPQLVYDVSTGVYKREHRCHWNAVDVHCRWGRHWSGLDHGSNLPSTEVVRSLLIVLPPQFHFTCIATKRSHQWNRHRISSLNCYYGQVIEACLGFIIISNMIQCDSFAFPKGTLHIAKSGIEPKLFHQTTLNFLIHWLQLVCPSRVVWYLKIRLAFVLY